MPQEREPCKPAVVAWEVRAPDRTVQGSQQPQWVGRSLVRVGLAGVLGSLSSQCNLFAEIGRGWVGEEPVSFGHLTCLFKEAEQGDDRTVGLVILAAPSRRITPR